MKRRDLRVQEWMTLDPYTVQADTTVGEAYDVMLEAGVRRLPVVDGAGEVEGIITLSDIQWLIPWSDESSGYEVLALSRSVVRDLMAWDPVTVFPDDTIREAAARMLDYQVSGLPVIEERRLVGIISESDIFRLFVTALPKPSTSHPVPIEEPGWCLWFTGVPAAGKSTLARALHQHVRALGGNAVLLDSDEVRRIVTPTPTTVKQNALSSTVPSPISPSS